MDSTSRAKEAKKPRVRKNGRDPEAFASGDDAQQQQVLEALQAARRGDFAVRLPTRGGNGRMNEIALEFNAVIGLNETLAREIVRVERVVGREGRMTERVAVSGTAGNWENERRRDQRADRRPGAADDRGRPRASARSPRAISAQKMALEIEGQPVKGEFLRIGTTVNSMVDQLSLVRRRSHARRQGSRHRRQAGRSGGGARGGRHVARPDRQRQPAGVQPHRLRCATSPRSRRPSPRATCRRRSRSTPRARCSS